MSATAAMGLPKRTPLYDSHVALGAKLVPFAGYDMPVQYAQGVLKEHVHTRTRAGLFDVSHMGQALIEGPDHATVAAALERLVPADIIGLKPGQQRYTQLLNESGGCHDDLMVTRAEHDDGKLFLVVNAGCKDKDYEVLRAGLPGGVSLFVIEDRALLALQGPEAERVIEGLIPGVGALAFMTAATFFWTPEVKVYVSRSGYTGEDGFEISVHQDQAVALWQALLAEDGVEPIGLGARDSLRLEAGLCLYGHELDETVSPVEAQLVWSIQKRRRVEGGFPGAARVQAELLQGPSRVRVGFMPEGRAPAREGPEILSGAGDRIGVVTSGGFGPTINHPLAMGFVAPDHAAPGTRVQLVVRGKPLPASVVALPFVPNRFVRKR
jgi:aminomethyltransferase